jgi:hypothetical protein
VFTADHGEEFHEHGGWEHGRTVYREVAAIPLVLRLPFAGTRDRRPGAAQLADVLPTLMDALGLDPPARIDGRSLLSVSGKGAPRAAFSHLDLDGNRADAAVEPPWKLVRTPEGVALYEGGDEGEHRDVADDHPLVTRYLRAVLAEHETLGPPALASRTVYTIQPDVHRNLKALGYVE